MQLQDFSEPLQLFLLLNQKRNIHLEQSPSSRTADKPEWSQLGAVGASFAGEQPDGGTQNRLPPTEALTSNP